MEKKYAEYLFKKTIQDYNLIAEDFSSARTKPWLELKFLFDDYLTSGEKVLDLGCGNGRFLEFLEGKSIDYFGIDPSEKLIEIASKKHPEANFQVADALSLPFPDDYFDKVYSIAVFQHIPSEELRLRFLEEVIRVLKPRGLFIATIWNLWRKSYIKILIKNSVLKIFGKSKLDLKDFFMPEGKPSLFRNFYYHCFTKRELRRLIKRVGLKTKKAGIIVMSVGRKPHFNFYIVAEK